MCIIFIGNFINLSISEGALDCWISTYTGKKNRLGNIINILCDDSEKEKFINLIIILTVAFFCLASNTHFKILPILFLLRKY